MARRKRQAKPSDLTIFLAAGGGLVLLLSVYVSVDEPEAHEQSFLLLAGLAIACLALIGGIYAFYSYATRQQRAKAKALLQAHDVDNMTGKEFELFLGTILTARGYTVKKIFHSRDGGVDIIARKDNETYSIQAKRYKAGKKADRRAITDAVAGITYAKCTHAMAITNSYFTKAATEYAHATKCILIDRDELGKWLIELSE